MAERPLGCRQVDCLAAFETPMNFTPTRKGEPWDVAIQPVIEIEADDEKDARERFPEKIRALGYACTAMPDDLISIEGLE